MTENPSIQEVLNKLEKIGKVAEKDGKLQSIANKFDTIFSEEVFQVEEKYEDNNLNGKKRRDWLILADIYNGKNQNQWFHLNNYLKFKEYDPIDLSLSFRKKCYPYIKNVALILYIRQVIFEEEEKSLENLHTEAMKRYKNKKNNINDAKFASKMRK